MINVFREKEITWEGVKHELNKMGMNKSTGNDGLTKKIYETFWDRVKVPLSSSQNGFSKKGTSQKQAVINLMEVKDHNKRLTKNWRPITLLNVDVKLISKVLSNRIKNLISNAELDFEYQNGYVANRSVSEGCKLMSDILEIIDFLNMEGYLLAIGIEKAFDSVDD